MESKVNYTLVGLFVVIVTALAIAMAFWLSAKMDGKKYSPYLVYVSEGVSGLTETSPVKFNGVTVGYVRQITLNKQNLQQVELLLYIVEGTPITTTTYASLKTQGITGLTYVELRAKTPEAPLLTAKKGQKYPVVESEKSIFTDITDSVKELFDEQNIEAISQVIANLETFTQSLADGSPEITASLANTQAILENTRIASEQFADFISELRVLTQEVGQVSHEFNQTVRVGRHTLQSFQQQALPATISLLERIDTVAANVEILTEELTQDPAIIIRGKVPASRGPGE